MIHRNIRLWVPSRLITIFNQQIVHSKQTDKRKGRSLPAAVLITSLALELVGREDCEDALLRAEVLPLYPWVGLQVVCKHCGQKRTYV